MNGLDTILGQALLAILGLFITAAVGGVNSWLRANLKEKNYMLLQEVAYDAVHAAEQGALGGMVRDKKSSAMRIAVESLASMGVKVTINQVDAAIEAAVLRAFNQERVNAKPTEGSN